MNCRHELNQTCSKQILGRDKVTNTFGFQFAFLLQGFVSLRSEIVDMNSIKTCSKQILGRDKVTNTLGFSISVGSCNILCHSLSYIDLIIKSTHKKKSAMMTGCIQRVYCNFEGKLLLNFDSIGFSYTKGMSVVYWIQPASIHKEGYIYIYI